MGFEFSAENFLQLSVRILFQIFYLFSRQWRTHGGHQGIRPMMTENHGGRLCPLDLVDDP